jgi:hypothetical protein
MFAGGGIPAETSEGTSTMNTLAKLAAGAVMAGSLAVALAPASRAETDRTTSSPVRATDITVTRIPVRYNGPRNICAPGYSWQYGCTSWNPAQPGQLFGTCRTEGYSCMRIPGPIQ